MLASAALVSNKLMLAKCREQSAQKVTGPATSY